MEPTRSQKAIHLFIKLAELSGFISREQSIHTNRSLQGKTTNQSTLPSLIAQLGMKPEIAQLLWKVVKIAPAIQKQKIELDTLSTSKVYLPIEEVQAPLRKEIFFADELVRRRMVPLEAINQALKEIQKSRETLSIGQILMKKHLITPSEFVQITQELQQALQENKQHKISCRISRSHRSEVIELVLPDTPTYIAHYEIIREIARGGMGVVYEALDTQLNRVVALKTLIAGEMADPSEIERFQREAKLAASFNHPGIVPIHEVGIYENTHYFTMDYIEGISLSEYVRKTKLPLRKIVKMMIQIADALGYAHVMGVIHRDIKPANILVDTSGRPLITDFGLARQQNSRQGLTMSGIAIGTPAYMSPEQAQGKIREIDVRSDIYSLGAVFYELLAGRPPFSGTSLADTLQAVIHEDPVPLRQLVPGLPVDIETVCMKCLEKDKRKRYPNTKGLIRDMERFLRGDSIRAKRTTPWEVTLKFIQKNKITVLFFVTIIVLLFFLASSWIESQKYWRKKQELEKEAKLNQKQIQEVEKKLKIMQTQTQLARDEIRRKEREIQRLKQKLGMVEKELKLAKARKIKVNSLVTSSNTQNIAKVYTYKAMRLLKQNMVEEAIKLIKKAIQLDPKLAIAYNAYGIALYKRAKYAESIESFNKAISLQPTLGDAYNGRGVVFLQLHELDKAKRDFTKAIEINPAMAIYYSNRGIVWIQKKLYHNALKDLTRAIKLNPLNVGCYYNRGSVYLLLKRYKAALADFEYCAKNFPNFNPEEIQEKIEYLKMKLKRIGENRK